MTASGEKSIGNHESESSHAKPGAEGEKWLKTDFHLHSSEDLADKIDHSAMELLQRAHQLGFHALAITLHDTVLARPELFEAAQAFGILLIPAAEMRIEGADVVILNLTEEEAAALKSFRDLENLRTRRGNAILVFVPHPFFILGGSIGHRIHAHLDCFDAIEYSHFHTRWFNLNSPAARLAEKMRKPMLATSDAHRLDFFGSHYSLVRIQGEATVDAIFSAIRAGDLRPISPPWRLRKFMRYIFYVLVIHPIEYFFEKLSR